MKSYLIVESEGVYQSSLRGMELAVEFAENQAHVILWLVQDAVQVLQFTPPPMFTRCLALGNIAIYLDDFACRQRGCHAEQAADMGITVAGIELLSDQLMKKDRVAIWH